MAANRETPRRLPRAGWLTRILWLPALVFLLGVGASILGYSVERKSQQLQAATSFAEAASARASAIWRAFEHGIDTTESIVGLFAASEEVTREEFASFVAPVLEGHPAVQGVGWAPVVPHAQRALVERKAKARVPGFQFTVRETQGAMVVAPEAPEYVPVLYLEPRSGNEAALGYDLASDPNRSISLEEARTSGEIVATGRIRLVQETEGQYGFLLIAPIYPSGIGAGSMVAERGEPIGFASVVFRTGDLIANSLALLEPAGIDVAVFDASAQSDERLLHFTRSRLTKSKKPATEPSGAISEADFERETRFAFGGRELIVATRPASGYFEANRLRPRMALAVGLTISTILSGLFLVVRRRAAEAARSNRALSREIAERRAAEERLLLFQSIIDASAESIYFVDPETGRFTYANKKATRESGYSQAELLDLTVQEVAADGPLTESATGLSDWVRELERRPTSVVEVRQRRKNGEIFTVEASVSLAIAGEQSFIVGIAEDISERKKAEEQQVELRERLLALSFLDGLTGIANRRRFDEYLSTEWRRAARQVTPLGLVLIDLDHFKLYNDRYGHLLGDECLRKVAGVLKSSISRPADLVARFGGEEMVVLLPETSRDGVLRMAEKVRRGVEELKIEHGDSSAADVVTVSAGVGWCVPKPGDSLDKFLEAVDAALYRAKREGRNRSEQA